MGGGVICTTLPLKSLFPSHYLAVKSCVEVFRFSYLWHCLLFALLPRILRYQAFLLDTCHQRDSAKSKCECPPLETNYFKVTCTLLQLQSIVRTITMNFVLLAIPLFLRILRFQAFFGYLLSAQ